MAGLEVHKQRRGVPGCWSTLAVDVHVASAVTTRPGFDHGFAHPADAETRAQPWSCGRCSPVPLPALVHHRKPEIAVGSELEVDAPPSDPPARLEPGIDVAVALRFRIEGFADECAPTKFEYQNTVRRASTTTCMRLRVLARQVGLGDDNPGGAALARAPRQCLEREFPVRRRLGSRRRE